MGLSVTLGFAEEFKPNLSVYRSSITPYLKQYCVSCHGPDKQKGGFRVDQDLGPNFNLRHVGEKWHEVLNVINAGEMPTIARCGSTACTSSPISAFSPMAGPRVA